MKRSAESIFFKASVYLVFGFLLMLGYQNCSDFSSGRSSIASTRNSSQCVAVAVDAPSGIRVYQESQGYVAMEMESTQSPLGGWAMETSRAGFTGENYLRFNDGRPEGVARSPEDGSPLDYYFQINTTGVYRFVMRAHRCLLAREDICNDAFVRVEGNFESASNDITTEELKNFQKYFSPQGNNERWTYAGNMEVFMPERKGPPTYRFTAGEVYKVSISGRSREFEIDQIAFFNTQEVNSNDGEPFPESSTSLMSPPTTDRIFNDDSLGSGGDEIRCLESTIPNPSGLQGDTQGGGNNSSGSFSRTGLFERLSQPVGQMRAGDLLVLHYDNAPDPDDGHCQPAALAMADRHGLNPLVVNGTWGESQRTVYKTASESVFDATWGPNNWLDANGQRENAIQVSMAAWRETLESGSEVWISEGGPSDFTNDVLQRLQSQSPGLNFKNIHVIQHAAFNNRETVAANLTRVQNLTSWLMIDNGNFGSGLTFSNGQFQNTADLKYWVQNDGDNVNLVNQFEQRALASSYAAQWRSAFNYFPPNNNIIDFSDTVLLLYILDVPVSQISNPMEFADIYF